MKVFDLHCDTITIVEKNGGSLFKNDLHVSLERADIFNSFVQVFAVFIPDELRGEAAVAYFDRIYECYKNEMKKNEGLLSGYYENKDTKMKAILAVEGGAAAAGTLAGLRHLYDCGVRLVTLTWNAQNEIGSGCWAEPDSGLTAFGVSAVAEMERLGMVVDVSHLSKKGFWDVAHNSSRPFIASHSNCDIVNNIYAHRRNLDDEQIRCIIERGGLMGINLCDAFMGYGCGEEMDCAREPFEALYRHVDHALELGAENILALGCDYDGCTLAGEFTGVEKLADIYEFLLSKNISNELCERMFYVNADKFFSSMA